MHANMLIYSPVLLLVIKESRYVRHLQMKKYFFATQDEPRGTGHAVLCALGSLPKSGLCVVMCGDTPLFRGETLLELVQQHEKESPLVTVLTTIVSEPLLWKNYSGYFRYAPTNCGGCKCYT